MNDLRYNHENMTGYLLGTLPEAESERLDELSFTSEEFVESLRATEQDLVDAYVQGELSSEALTHFESHYLASHSRRAQVEFARGFQEFGMKTTSTKPARVEGTGRVKYRSQRKSAGGFFARGSLNASRFAWQSGFALAALLLLVAGGFLVFQNIRLRQQMLQTQTRHDELQKREQELQAQLESQRLANSATEQELARVREEQARLGDELRRSAKQFSAAPAAAVFILTPQLRSAGQIKTVAIPKGAARVIMHLLLEPNDFRRYSVALIDGATSRVAWRSEILRPGATGNQKTLEVTLNTDLLKPKTYTLQVSGVAPNGGSEHISDYPFKVLSKS